MTHCTDVLMVEKAMKSYCARSDSVRLYILSNFFQGKCATELNRSTAANQGLLRIFT
jgi:hypothetical protein